MQLTRRELALALAAISGCTRSSLEPRNSSPTVTVYTALDQEFSEPLFAPFERDTGIRVLAKFDTEATKSVGLANTIRVEAQGGKTRCDLFWNN